MTQEDKDELKEYFKDILKRKDEETNTFSLNVTEKYEKATKENEEKKKELNEEISQDFENFQREFHKLKMVEEIIMDLGEKGFITE